jgi:single-stranded-DNA-specific exonuclease
VTGAVSRSIRRREPRCTTVSQEGWPDLLSRVMANRGVADSDSLGTCLAEMIPVGLLAGVREAAQLLLRHRDAGRVLIVGDFDADGATSTALMMRALQAMGFHSVDFLVPNRFEFGYGLTPEIVQLALKREPTLLVTVDNGISSIEGARQAARAGLDLLITDHHLPPAGLPIAQVIVNPNLAGSEFPSKNLAGVGVAFYVMAALARELACGFSPADLLDLVALGTIADVVPMDKNNRILAQEGLKRIRAGKCAPGILALLELSGRDVRRVTASDLAFAVAPRLNAAGRLDDMSLGIRCLLTQDPEQARQWATELDQLNRERRDIEGRMQEQALEAVKSLQLDGGDELPLVLCLFDPGWHQGVVGLVASRIKDKVHRPVFAFARTGEGELKGSARSVNGLHIRDAMDNVATRHPGLLDKFGGHAMAAGLSLAEGDLDAFRQAMQLEVGRWQDGMDLEGVLWTDGPLGPEEFRLENAEMIREFAPWGQQFPEPRFDGLFHVLESRIVGDKHLKMRVRHSEGGQVLDAIAFGQGELMHQLGQNTNLVYRLEVNEWQGKRSLQLMVEHIQPG